MIATMTARGFVPPPPTRYGPKTALQRQASPARKPAMRVVRSWGGATIQRAAEAVVRQVVLKPLEGEYKKLLDCLNAYCRPYVVEHKVEHWLGVGQALGRPAPAHTGHHSDAGGNDTNDQRAATNQEHYQTWLAAQRVHLDRAVVAAPAPKPKSKALYQTASQHEATVKAKQDKSKKKELSDHEDFHAKRKNIGKTCGVCKKKVTG